LPLIHQADSILIFGPGEAKSELQKRFEHKNMKVRIISNETTDKMTDRQIAAKIRERFSY